MPPLDAEYGVIDGDPGTLTVRVKLDVDPRYRTLTEERCAGVIGGKRRPSHQRFIPALAPADILARITGSAFKRRQWRARALLLQ